ncbi:MAG TPA: outer membrane beta-barrel protein [Gemmatimonadales bacterium]|nr:outer membrane beta-barrel protein [Gemmatimonadales bacterium]
MRTRLAVAALLLVPAALQGQSRFSVEVGAHAAVPIQDFGNAELETGLGFGANIRYRIQPHLAAYAGWEWQHFTTEVLATDLDVEETGYTFGLRFEHPFGAGRPAGEAAPAWWIRAGGLIDHIELEDDAGEGESTSHGLGWEAGFGISYPLSARVALAPGLRIRMLRREIDMGFGLQDATLSYLTAGLGVVIGF